MKIGKSRRGSGTGTGCKKTQQEVHREGYTHTRAVHTKIENMGKKHRRRKQKITNTKYVKKKNTHQPDCTATELH